MINYAALLTYMGVTSVTPGPNNLTCLYLGATGPLRSARSFLAGSWTGLFVKALLCGALNVALAETVPALVPYLKWVGAAYMLYLGFVMAREGFRKDEEESPRAAASTFMGGIALQCLNVKSWVAALSIFSVYVIPHTTALSAIVLASAAFLLFVIVCSLAWFLFGRAIQRLYRRWKKPISLLMGASLVYCAITALR